MQMLWNVIDARRDWLVVFRVLAGNFGKERSASGCQLEEDGDCRVVRNRINMRIPAEEQGDVR